MPGFAIHLHAEPIEYGMARIGSKIAHVEAIGMPVGGIIPGSGYRVGD